MTSFPNPQLPVPGQGSSPQLAQNIPPELAINPGPVPPVSSSSNSPDTLPQAGYTLDQLCRYIQRRLGSPTWVIELPKQSLLDMCQDALAYYSMYRPRLRFGTIALSRGRNIYLQGTNMGQGPVVVEFVQPNPVPIELFWGNLIDPAPLLRRGLDDLDSFCRWQKVWMRVTSIKPDWSYDCALQQLYIYNPLDRYWCGLQWYDSYTDTVWLDQPTGTVWVKEYAFQKCRQAYAELLSKYSGAVPGPVANLQLDAGKRDLAQTQIEKLEAQLFAMQVSSPLQID